MQHDKERPQAGAPYPPPPPIAPYPPRPPQRGEAWTSGTFSPAIFLVALLVIGTLVGAALLNRRATDTPPAAPTTAAPAAGQPAATTPPAKSYVVANTGGDGVYLRRSPNLTDRIRAYPEGTRLVAVGPDTAANGETWHNVRAPDGQVGYVPARYTADAP